LSEKWISNIFFLQGSEVAAEKAVQLDVFKKAQLLKINPDKPQENIRLVTLQVNPLQ
jgi:hypothetical protein